MRQQPKKDWNNAMRNGKAPFCVQASFRHADEVGELTKREADAEFTQVTAGPFEGRTTRLVLDGVKLHHTWTAPTTIHYGAPDPALAVFVLPVRWRKDLIWNGESIEQPSIFNIGSEYVRRATDYEAVVLAFRRDRLEGDVAALLGVEPQPLPTGALLGREGLVRPAMQALTEVARAVTTHPASFEDPLASQRAEEMLFSAILQVLTGISPHRIRKIDPRSKTRIVRRVKQLLEESGNQPVSLAELCRATKVSARTLQYAFRDLYGVSPTRYIRLRRLHEARRTLLRADDEPGAVKKAAFDSGFVELGRFAAEYRRLFGELPSETLRLP